MWMYQSRALLDPPDTISSEDRERLMSAVMLRTRQATILYEDLITRYGELPYLLVRLAELRTALCAPVLAAILYTKAHQTLSSRGVHDTVLDFHMRGFVPETFSKAQDLHTASLKVRYHQPWKTTRELCFPLHIGALPSGCESIETDWSYLTSEPEFLMKYLRLLIIETNHIEDTFLLTTECTHDIIRQGVSQARIVTEYESNMHEDDIIKSVLKDTLEAYEEMLAIAHETRYLTKSIICRIHSLIMKTCRFHNSHGQYIPPGKTRTETMQTVIIGGGSSYPIQCCPYAKVDEELDYVCQMFTHWAHACDNPFAIASWLHLVLARCHPFNDGNGRLSRIIASIPLVKAGYPPISIMLTQRPEYYQAINKAYDGDHSLIIQCIIQGMKVTAEMVKGLL